MLAAQFWNDFYVNHLVRIIHNKDFTVEGISWLTLTSLVIIIHVKSRCEAEEDKEQNEAEFDEFKVENGKIIDVGEFD